jgi:NAD(P)-dependent dehydrogenase (short-subunit alcohol dehydrogenase family)
MPSISGQSILVLGGSSGIGAAVAKLAAEQGVHVSIASSNPTRVSNAVKALKDAVPHAKITGFTIDLDTAQVEDHLVKLLTDITSNGTKLDHIVFTANSLNLKPLDQVTVDYLRNSGQFGLVVPMILAKLAPRFLNSSYKSSLIFTSGRVAEKPVKGYTMGAAFGAALFGITRSLALDLAPIRVNCVSPGATDTELWGNDEQRAQRRQMYTKIALLGKAGTAEEVGEAYIYLMRDFNNTGTTVSTSGGALIQ